MLAIPVLRSRVAPVLNWCSRVHLFPEEPSAQGAVQQLYFPYLEASQRLNVLQDNGVTTLICGALSPDLLHLAQQLGFTVICGVAGEVEEVLRSYWDNRLHQPKFRLPGCCGEWARFRPHGLECGGGKGRGRCHLERSTGKDLEGAFAERRWCPACGFAVHPALGFSPFQVRCPRCGGALVSLKENHRRDY